METPCAWCSSVVCAMLLCQRKNLWSAPMSGYNAPQLGNSNAGYILSAIVGVILITIVVWLFAQLLLSRKTIIKP